jgi:hypothetical protein
MDALAEQLNRAERADLDFEMLQRDYRLLEDVIDAQHRALITLRKKDQEQQTAQRLEQLYTARLEERVLLLEARCSSMQKRLKNQNDE